MATNINDAINNLVEYSKKNKIIKGNNLNININHSENNKINNNRIKAEYEYNKKLRKNDKTDVSNVIIDENKKRKPDLFSKVITTKKPPPSTKLVGGDKEIIKKLEELRREIKNNKNNTSFIKPMKDVFSGMKNVITAPFKLAKNVVNGTFIGMKNVITAPFKLAKDKFNEIKSKITTPFQKKVVKSREEILQQRDIQESGSWKKQTLFYLQEIHELLYDKYSQKTKENIKNKNGDGLLGLITLFVPFLISKFKNLFSNIKNIFGGLTGFFKNIGKGFSKIKNSKVGKWIIDKFDDVWRTIKNSKLMKFFTKFGDDIAKFGSKIKNFFNIFAKMGAGATSLSKIFQPLLNVFTKMGKFLKIGPLMGIMSFFDFFVDAFKSIRELKKGNIKGFISGTLFGKKEKNQKTGSYVGGQTLKWAGAGMAIGSVIPGVGTIVGGLVGASIGAIGALFKSGKIKEIVNGVIQKTSDIFDKIKKVLKNVIENFVIKPIQWYFDFITTPFRVVGNFLKSFQGKNNIDEKEFNIKDKILDIGTKIKDLILNMLNLDIWGSIKDSINNFKNEIIDKAKNIFNSKTSVENISKEISVANKNEIKDINEFKNKNIDKKIEELKRAQNNDDYEKAKKIQQDLIETLNNLKTAISIEKDKEGIDVNNILLWEKMVNPDDLLKYVASMPK